MIIFLFTSYLSRFGKSDIFNFGQDLVVIKEYPKNEIEHSFKNELKAYISFQYPGDGDQVSKYFLKYYGSFKQNGKGFIILEYADEGSLLEFFKSNKVPRTREELHGLFQNLSGLLFGLRLLHAQDPRKTNRQLRGVHQDLKPANIFVCRNENGDAYKYNFKIGDFGLTSFTPNEANEIKSRDNKGGIMYSAPEMVNYDDFSRSLDEGISHFVDIWSFGCVLFEAAVWAISDERGREEFRSLRCEENDQNLRLRAQGYEASFHNGTRRLYAVDKMLERILEQQRVFDDLTEGFCKLLLKYSMVPMRENRYDARELGVVVKDYLDNHRTSQSSWIASSPTGKTSLSELDNMSNSRLFEHPRASTVFENGHYNTSINRSLSGGDRSFQRRFDRGMRISETYILDNPRSSSQLPERAYSDDQHNFEQLPSLPAPISQEPLPSNGNELTADSKKEPPKNGEIAKSQVTEQSIQTPSDKQTDYPKFRVPDVINWIMGGKRHSDELYRRLSSALETLKKRQQVCLIGIYRKGSSLTPCFPRYSSLMTVPL
jgi:serine/threonine protein kinase